MVLTPNSEDQHIVSEIIIRLISNTNTNDDKEQLIRVLSKLVEQGADAILLACTDLQIVLKEEDSPVPLLDTCNILAESTLNILLEKISIKD